jgi:hypothetical protein
MVREGEIHIVSTQKEMGTHGDSTNGLASTQFKQAKVRRPSPDVAYQNEGRAPSQFRCFVKERLVVLKE